MRALLGGAGIESDVDSARGLDHGVFIPLMLAYPDAEVPVLRLSLRSEMDPAAHLAIGRALVPLRDEGVLIIGSGMSYHNLRSLFSPGGADAAERFDAWLEAAATAPAPAARNRSLTQWATAPGAREAHPEPEHLMPLMVAAGAAAADRGYRNYRDRIAGKPFAGYRFG